MVTLNIPIADAHVIKRIDYRHPIYDAKITQAQQRWQDISGQNHTHFCGEYWFNGFHEDGVKSGLRVCQRLGVAIDILETPTQTTIEQIKRLSSYAKCKKIKPFDLSMLPIHADKKLSVVKRRHVTVTTNHEFCQTVAKNGLAKTKGKV